MVWVLKKMKSGHFTGCRKPLSKTMQVHRLFWEIFSLRESEQKKMSVKLLNGLKKRRNKERRKHNSFWDVPTLQELV